MSVEGLTRGALHLADAFAAASLARPDRPCLLSRTRSLSYGELDREARALAAGLAAHGVRAGDRIASVLPNCPEAVATLLAASRLGAVLVPINPSLSYLELKYELRHAEAALAVTAPDWSGRDLVEWFDELMTDAPETLSLVAVGGGDSWFDDRITPYLEVVSRGHHLPEPDGPRDPDSMLTILYTSGTMGKPKGVCLSHRNVVGSAVQTSEVLRLGVEDRVLMAVPNFTIFGLSVTVGALVNGAALVLQERFEQDEAVRLMASEGVTVCHGVPTMFALMLRDGGFTREALPALRTGLIAGSPVGPNLVRQVREVCDVEIAYGLTETGPTVAMTRSDDPVSARAETVGRAMDGVDVRIMDPASGGDAGAGAVGELAVRGPNVMSGYHRMPAETRRVFGPDGYFLTGDLAARDDAGYLRIEGRRKEMIIRGGYKVYPREVEDVLRAHPAVGELCVVGVPHEVLGEMICACIVPIEGAVVRGEDITDFARGQMADYKVPDLVRFFDALPQTASGKVKRRELVQVVAHEQTA